MFEEILKIRNNRNDDEIGPYELAEGLTRYFLTPDINPRAHRFSPSVAEKLVAMFDRNNSLKLDLTEFRGAFAFMEKMKAGFKKRDADQSGVLEEAEIRAAVEESGYHLTVPCFQMLFKKFANDRKDWNSTGVNDGLRFDMYVSLSVLLARVGQIYGYYDRNRSGLVTFNFDSFFAALLSAK